VKTRRRAEEDIDSRDRRQLLKTEEKGRHGLSITEVGKVVAVSRANDLHGTLVDERTHARTILRDETLNTRHEIRRCYKLK